MFPDTVWPHYAPNLLKNKKAYILWKKNGEPPVNSFWAIPIFSFLGNLSFDRNGFLQIDPHLSTLAKSEPIPKPFVAGTSVWYFGKIKKDGFRIEIRLKKGVLFSHISLPLDSPNEKALSVLQAFWGKRGDLEKLFPAAT